METAPTSSANTVLEHRLGEFLISTDRARLDLDLIHGFLTGCYWAKGIPRDVVARSIEHSLCFGIYDGSGEKSPRPAKDARPFDDAQGRHGAPASVQVGFARVVSDFATVAYLGDVFILEPYRGRGLSKWLMECIMQHPALQGLRRWILLTRDAHGLYSQFGFTPLKSPERYMELHRPDVYEVP
jgi:GNAT superfamily N-acetyltransferase